MSVPISPTELSSAAPHRLTSRLLPYFLLCAMLWLTLCDGRMPAFLSSTVKRTLYFKLPIAGTRFHWEFLDRRAFLAGELTLRIINSRRNRDETMMIFSNGQIAKGWEMIGDAPRDGSFYFGFSTDELVATAEDDSLIVKLTVTEDLRGRGPYSQGTLGKGTWVASGVYSGLYGGTLNPIKALVRAGKPAIAFLTCWDTVWELRDANNQGWMGLKPSGEDDTGLRHQRGINGRQCRSTL